MTTETINKEDLIASIIKLTSSMRREDVLTTILDEMDTVTLKTIIQKLVDPMYEVKDKVYVNSARFTSTGKLQMYEQQKQQELKDTALDTLTAKMNESID